VSSGAEQAKRFWKMIAADLDDGDATMSLKVRYVRSLDEDGNVVIDEPGADEDGEDHPDTEGYARLYCTAPLLPGDRILVGQIMGIGEGRDVTRIVIDKIANSDDQGNDNFRPSGWFDPPGPKIVDASAVTALVNGQSLARYIGQAPYDLSEVFIRFRVTTALVGVSWSDIGLATAQTSTGGGLTTVDGSVANVSTDVDTTGVKTITLPADGIEKGTHVYVLMGSSAATPFQVRATLSDDFQTGYVRLATARPYSMAANTAFSSSSAVTGAAALAVRWG
jgi:hypothetical protein